MLFFSLVFKMNAVKFIIIPGLVGAFIMSLVFTGMPVIVKRVDEGSSYSAAFSQGVDAIFRPFYLLIYDGVFVASAFIAPIMGFVICAALYSFYKKR